MGSRRSEKIVVLCVDDEDFSSRTILLEKKGLDVISAHSPQEALEILRSRKIDVVVSDLHFDGISAYKVQEFLEKCVANGAGILIFTGSYWKSPPREYEGMMLLDKLALVKEVHDAIVKCHEENMAKKAKKIRILMVDNNKDIIETFPEALRSEGYYAKGCKNPLEARQLLASESFDVVVSDLHFLGFAQYEIEIFLREILNSGKGLMICSASEWADMPKIEGAVLYQKPGTYEKFMVAIKETANLKGPAMISDEVLRILVNPDKHVETPVQKWESSLLSEKTEGAYLRLYREYLSRELRAGVSDCHRTRDLNDLMGKFQKISAKVK